MPDFPNQTEVAQTEHLSPKNTGDNISAKRVAGYKFDGNNWWRDVTGLLQAPYDEVAFSNPDGNDNYQTITTKLSGTTQNVLTLTFDGSSNLTDIARTT